MENASQNCVTGISPENNAARSHGNYQADIANDGGLEGRTNYRRVSSHETGVVDNSMETQTLKLSLHVISGAGYGRSFDWNSSGEIPPVINSHSINLCAPWSVILFYYSSSRDGFSGYP
jgi:hypothetical protein